jgi:beta-lactamase class A
MNRRTLLKNAALGAAVLALRPAISSAAGVNDTAAQLATLERKHGGRLGVAILDTGNGYRIAYRGDERFLMCSTFKLLLVAAVLKRVDDGSDRLDRRIAFDKSALLEWAPVTRFNVGPPGMTVEELCEAAMIISDNAAANLLLNTIGGPPGVTAYARSLGDTMTRLDHPEPLNNRQHGVQDTTTPWSMLADMQKVLLGDALSVASRRKLTNWFSLNQTGAQTLRAGLPSDWEIGDKTGSATHANNDIAIITPPRRKPLLVTAYYMTDTHDVASRKAVLADVGRIAAAIQPDGPIGKSKP